MHLAYNEFHTFNHPALQHIHKFHQVASLSRLKLQWWWLGWHFKNIHETHIIQIIHGLFYKALLFIWFAST